MYQACRHIKPSGERCKSPAMRDHSFCYFHARVHVRTRHNAGRTLHSDRDNLNFPVPEDFAAIQESVAKVLDDIVNERISHKESAQILSGLRIAMRTIPRNPVPPTDSVREITFTKKGDELAPPLEICPPVLETGNNAKALPASVAVNPANVSAISEKALPAPVLETPNNGKALPAPAGFDSANSAAGPALAVEKLQTGRVEILASLTSAQLSAGKMVIGAGKVLDCLDQPDK